MYTIYRYIEAENSDKTLKLNSGDKMNSFYFQPLFLPKFPEDYFVKLWTISVQIDYEFSKKKMDKEP